MVNPFKRLWTSDSDKPSVFLSLPSILYHTHTERTCKNYLKDYFDTGKIHTPFDFRKKDRTFFKELIKESEIVVGLTIKDVYTYPVWKDLTFSESIGKSFFTLRVVKDAKGRDLHLYLIDGMADFDKLSWDETEELYLEIQKENIGFIPLMFGKRPEY
jgi:hypothetical protein